MRQEGAGSLGGEGTDDRAFPATDPSNDAVLGIDPDGIVTRWSKGAERLYGVPAAEAVGRPLSALLGSPQGSTLGTERELRDHRRLQEISRQLVSDGDIATFYGDLVDVAIEIAEADRGTMQAYDNGSGELNLLTCRGMPEELRAASARVGPGARSSCAEALRSGERATVDFVVDESVAGTPDAQMHLDAGIRAAQSTPLMTRSGRLVGMLSTHWDRPYRLLDRQADLLDILARQVADLIESAEREEALRMSERRARLRSEQFETLVDQAPIGVYFLDSNLRLQQANPVARELFSSYSGSVVGWGIEGILRSMWGEDRAREILRNFRHTLETGEPHHVAEFAEVRADRGVTEYYDWRIERIVLPKGGHGVVCYFRDISTEVEARIASADSDVRYQRLFNSMDQGFAVIEVIMDEAGEPADYRFLETNPAFERHSGLESADGRRILELVPDLEPHWIELYGHIARTGESRSFVESSVALGRWFEVEAFRVGDPDDRLVAMLFTDITERKKARDALHRSEERLRLAKAAAGIGIHDFNPITGEIGWDARTRALWGVEADEPVTYDLWLSGIHPEDRDQAEEAVARSLDPEGDGIYYTECRVIHPHDGRTRWLELTGQTTFHGGRAVRLVGTVQDITEQKATYEALEEADRRKDEFLATLAHELRSPLSAIRTATTMLDQTRGEPVLLREMTEIIGRQSSHLVRLIRDLMDVSRISLGKIQLERGRVDIGEVTQDAARALSSQVREHGLTATVSVPDAAVPVDGDPVRLAQVVNNLMHNACKFTPPGGEIRVAVEPVGEEVIIRVSDTGVGMSPSKIARIFELFEQGEPRSPGQRPEGLGIGLSLSRSIVELHGGTIEARSEGEGKGSEFMVRMPVLRERTEEPEEPHGIETGPEGAESGRRVVVAEDNLDALQAMTLMLRLKGHEVIPAADGLEALEKVREHRPEVVLLDIGMPGMDGYQVARAVRDEPWGDEPLLVALTGWGQDADRERAFEAGFDTHLTKPASLRKLDELLRTARDGKSS